MAQVGWSVLRIDFVARMPGAIFGLDGFGVFAPLVIDPFPFDRDRACRTGGAAYRDRCKVDLIPGAGTRVPDGVVHDEPAFVVIVDRSGQMHGDGGFGEHRHVGLDATGT